MSLSNTEETKLLNHEYRTATYAKAANVWVALFSADPTDVGTLTSETDYTSYARVQVSIADSNWNAPADDGSGNMFISNVNPITFPNATGNASADVTHWATLDSSTIGAGNILDYGPLTITRPIVNGDTGIAFAAGALVIKRG